MKSLKLLTFVAASFAFGVAANAANALVDTLVRKGYLTQEEANSMASGSGMMSASRQHTTSITFEGLLHAQYDYFNVKLKDNATPAAEESRKNRGFPSMRRISLGIHAELMDNWSADLKVGNSVRDEAPVATPNARARMDVTHATINWSPMDEFNMMFGYAAQPFGLENGISGKDMKAMHTSIATRYFESSLGFGESNTGVFMNGEFMEGFYYSASLTRADGLVSQGKTADVSNRPAIIAGIGFMHSMDDWNFDIGIDGGFITGKHNAVRVGTHNSSAFAFSVHGDVTYMDFRLLGEFMMASIKEGDSVDTTSNSRPYAFFIQPSIMFEDQYELVAYYSYVNTKNTKTAIASNAYALVPGSVAASLTGTENSHFNKWHQFYIGGNWYIMGNDVKLSAGYDYTRGSDITTGGVTTYDKVEIHHVGARLQLLF